MSQHQPEDPPISDSRVAPQAEETVLALHAEELAVSRRVVERAVVRVATVTHTRDQLVDEALIQERVEVEHVAIGRMIDAMPPVRQEGDVTIMPVVEEILVVERRLLLKEEVHIRRVRTTQQHRETVVLREQEAVVTRIPTSNDPMSDQEPKELSHE
jgi:stress response protein YsnF